MLNQKVSSIGIYGCSFATDYNQHAWPSVLHERLQTSVTSYGQPGSCLMYAYHQFLKHHQSHDLNIFLVTEHTRENLFERQQGEYVYKIIHPDTHDLSESESIMYQGAELKRILYPDSYDFRLLAVLDSVKHRDPGAHIVNAMCHTNLFSGDMGKIQALDHMHLRGNNSPELEMSGIRPCHMSFRQNREFTEYLIQHLNGELDIHDTMGNNVQDYYTLSESLCEAGLLPLPGSETITISK